MLTLVCTNRKGGAGKTFLAVNVAAAYAQGVPTLLVDLDPQADASAWLGIEDDGGGLAEALSGRSGLDDVIQATDWGVDVAAGGEALGYVSSVAPDAVAVALGTTRRRYRAVVIDCPPGLSRMVLAGWRADSDALAVVPVDGPSALRAVVRLRNAWEDAGLDASRFRLVLNRFDRRRVLDRGTETEAARALPGRLLQTRVRDSVVAGEAAAWSRPLLVHAPAHPLTEDIRRLARELADG